MKQQEELTVITKTYDLILWACDHTGRFPRRHRYSLGDSLEFERKVREHLSRQIWTAVRSGD